MNTTAKTILGITVATTVGAVLGITLEPEQRAYLLLKVKTHVKDLINDFSSLIANRNIPSRESEEVQTYTEEELTSELINTNQYKKYS